MIQSLHCVSRWPFPYLNVVVVRLAYQLAQCVIESRNKMNDGELCISGVENDKRIIMSQAISIVNDVNSGGKGCNSFRWNCKLRSIMLEQFFWLYLCCNSVGWQKFEKAPFGEKKCWPLLSCLPLDNCDMHKIISIDSEQSCSQNNCYSPSLSDGVGVWAFHVNPRLHTSGIVWNDGLTLPVLGVGV